MIPKTVVKVLDATENCHRAVKKEPVLYAIDFKVSLSPERIIQLENTAFCIKDTQLPV